LVGSASGPANFTSVWAVNFNDLVLLARNYNSSGVTAVSGLGNSSFQDDWARAAAAVPEPTTLTLLSLGGVALLRRSRRD